MRVGIALLRRRPREVVSAPAPHGFAAQQRLVLRSLRAGVEDPVVKRAEIRSIQGLRGGPVLGVVQVSGLLFVTRPLVSQIATETPPRT